jgi:lysophospholipase L1-like esterase
MGGKNSIVDWANQKPSLANKDYVHPNHKGAEILANYLFEAFMSEYGKYTHHNIK